MIKSLSPYYLNIPFVSPASGLTCTSYRLEIFVWDGLKSAVPTTASYEITKANPSASNGTDKINIARLIDDFIDFAPQLGMGTELINGNNQRWVQTQVRYSTTTPSDFIPQLANVELMTRGYAYGMDGENTSTPANKILISSGNEFKVNRNGVFLLPILIEETVTPLSTLEITLINETVAPFYAITYIETGTHDEIYYRYRLQPETFWTAGDVFLEASPFAVELPEIAGVYDVQIFTFDTINSVNVYSNIYEYEIL